MRIAATILILTAAAALASPWHALIARKKANAGGGSEGLSAALLDSAQVGATSAASTWTISNVDFGAAATDRVIVVCAGVRSVSSFAFDVATIGGVNVQGSELASVYNGASVNYFHSYVFAAVVPTGTTGTIELSGTQNMSWGDVSVYRLTGYSSTPYDTAVHEQLSTTIDVSTNGFLVGCGASAPTGPNATMTGLSEDRDVLTAANDDVFASGSFTATTPESGRTIRINLGDGTYDAAAFASFEVLP